MLSVLQKSTRSVFTNAGLTQENNRSALISSARPLSEVFWLDSLQNRRFVGGSTNILPNSNQQNWFNRFNFSQRDTFIRNIFVSISLPRTTVNLNQILRVDGSVIDLNPSADLSGIDFQLQRPDGTWEDLPDITQLWSRSFSYNLNLIGRPPGVYQLWAQGYSRFFQPTASVSTTFVINAAPTDLQFNLNATTFDSSETLSITQGWIRDLNGSSDVQRVEFAVRRSDNTQIDVGDATNFTPWSIDNTWAGFSYSLDLRSLAPGSYTLQAYGVDRNGAFSDVVERSFVVTDWYTRNLRDPELIGLVRNLAADGSLNRNDMLNILRDAQDAAWGETALVSSSELLDLRAIINNSSRFNLQDHVRWLTDRIVTDTTINMSSDQFEANLVGRWFLGTIAPTSQFITHNDQGQSVTYNLTHVSVRGDLFGSSGQARIGDIDQGRLGDCTFLAALGATFGRQSNDSGNAISSLINSMIIDNGDNTYTIRFFANGAAEYVTVDRRLAIYGGRFFGASANGSANPNNPHNILWAPLVERAYAQWHEWRERRDLQPGYSLIGNGAHLVPVLQYVTGRNATHYDITGVTFNQLLVAVNNNQAVMAARYNSVSTTDIVGGHAYSVTNVYINNGEQRVVVRNPWGSDGRAISGSNDGFIDLSFASFRNQFEGIAIA